MSIKMALEYHFNHNLHLLRRKILFNNTCCTLLIFFLTAFWHMFQCVTLQLIICVIPRWITAFLWLSYCVLWFIYKHIQVGKCKTNVRYFIYSLKSFDKFSIISVLKLNLFLWKDYLHIKQTFLDWVKYFHKKQVNW